MKENQKQGRYGVFSLMAMIIGIVIGSGIFVKNAGLIAINGSIANTMIAWLLGAVLVVAILIAFLEIISITEISNEQATMTNWGKKLIGAKFGNYIGYYMVLVYFPMIIAGLLCFVSTQFAGTLNDVGVKILPDAALASQVTILSMASALVVTLVIMNSFSTNPGRILQNVGTIIKTIPLFFLVVLLIVLFAMGDVHIPKKEDIQTAAEFNNDKGLSSLTLILMTLPGILFSIDGFLLAGALSKESKSPTTFKTAFIISIIFILLIYISYSFATLVLGDPNETLHGDYGTISNVIFSVFKNKTVAKILAFTTDAIITLSMIVGISGCIIGSMRMYTDLSVHNAVIDKDFSSVTKNKHGVSVASGVIIGANVVEWLFISFTIDAIGISQGTDPLTFTGFMTDLVVVEIFIFYALIIISAIKNRFTKKVEVKKNIAFYPSAILASVLTIAITLYFGYLILWPFGLKTSQEWALWGIKLGFTIIFLVYQVVIFIFFNRNTSKLSEEFKEEKAVRSKIYFGEAEDYKTSEELNDQALNTILVMRAKSKKTTK